MSLLCNREEWAWLQSHVYSTTNGGGQSPEDESSMESGGLAEFIRSLRAAVTHLLTKLNIPLYRVTPRCNLSAPVCRKRPAWRELANWGLLFAHGRRTSTACTPASCCSLETRCPCCCCCLPARTSAPATGPWWAPRSRASPCRCRSSSWVGGEFSRPVNRVFPSNEDQHFFKNDI